MKLAVVPITEGAMDIIVENDHGDHDVYKPYECKLTKEQVEVMAKAYEFALDNQMNAKEAMEEALDSVGIEVE